MGPQRAHIHFRSDSCVLRLASMSQRAIDPPVVSFWRAVASSGFLAHPDALHMQRAPFAEGCQRRIKRLAKRRERVLNARRNFLEIPSLNNAIRLHFLEMLDQHFLADPRHQTSQFSETVALPWQRPQNHHLQFPSDNVERCLHATAIVLSHCNAPASLLTAR